MVADDPLRGAGLGPAHGHARACKPARMANLDAGQVWLFKAGLASGLGIVEELELEHKCHRAGAQRFFRGLETSSVWHDHDAGAQHVVAGAFALLNAQGIRASSEGPRQTSTFAREEAGASDSEGSLLGRVARVGVFKGANRWHQQRQTSQESCCETWTLVDRDE